MSEARVKESQQLVKTSVKVKEGRRRLLVKLSNSTKVTLVGDFFLLHFQVFQPMSHFGYIMCLMQNATFSMSEIFPVSLEVTSIADLCNMCQDQRVGLVPEVREEAELRVRHKELSVSAEVMPL